jgi:hypothetical protein
MGLSFELGVSSSDAITLYPEYDYKDASKLIESRHRTLSGRQYQYKWGDYEHFEFSLQYVSEANAAIVNSWWDSRAELLFFVNSGGATDVYSVMLMNKDNPLAGYNKPYDVYRKGKIILESY